MFNFINFYNIFKNNTVCISLFVEIALRLIASNFLKILCDFLILHVTAFFFALNWVQKTLLT